MVLQSKQTQTEGSPSFDADALFEAWDNGQPPLPKDNDLRSSIIATFNLPTGDNYVYHATASVTLAQVQSAIEHGGGSGLHAWYLDSEGKPVRNPKCRTLVHCGSQELDDLIYRAILRTIATAASSI